MSQTHNFQMLIIIKQNYKDQIVNVSFFLFWHMKRAGDSLQVTDTEGKLLVTIYCKLDTRYFVPIKAKMEAEGMVVKENGVVGLSVMRIHLFRQNCGC